MVDVLKYTKINDKIIDPVSIVFKDNISIWCQLPYPGHKNGCPNYGKGKFCPPNSPFYKEKIKEFDYLKLVYAVIDFRGYMNEMLQEHPNWSDKQLKCVLYWQNSVKRLLKDEIKKRMTFGYNYDILGCGSGFECYSMESVGINVMQTLKNNNIDIEVKPVSKVVLVALICAKRVEW